MSYDSPCPDWTSSIHLYLSQAKSWNEPTSAQLTETMRLYGVNGFTNVLFAMKCQSKQKCPTHWLNPDCPPFSKNFFNHKCHKWFNPGMLQHAFSASNEAFEMEGSLYCMSMSSTDIQVRKEMKNICKPLTPHVAAHWSLFFSTECSSCSANIAIRFGRVI